MPECERTPLTLPFCRCRYFNVVKKQADTNGALSWDPIAFQGADQLGNGKGGNSYQSEGLSEVRDSFAIELQFLRVSSSHTISDAIL